jgi:hypothetical protein
MSSTAHKIVKKANLQPVLDNFFRDIRVVEVIAALDIPTIKINGTEQRPRANIYFRKYTNKTPFRIDSLTKEVDTIFWIFDTFCVVEINASNDSSKQFVVLKHINKEADKSLTLLTERVLPHKFQLLKEAILEMKEPFENMVFEEAVNSLDKYKPTMTSKSFKERCISANPALR